MSYKKKLVSKGEVTYFSSDDALIGNGQKYSNFYYLHPNFLHCVIQTLDEVASVQIIKGKLIVEVMILRQ